MIRVGIVDDHAAVSDGLRAALNLLSGMEVVWTAPSLAAARAALEVEPAVDVVLLDVRLPDGSGLDLLPGVRSSPAFLVLSSFDRPQYASSAFDRGAAGFMLKVAPISEIGAAIRAIANGELAFPGRGPDDLRAPAPFTPRELEVVRLVARSFSNDEIAGRLGISPKTVEFYLGEIFRRHGFATRTELALWAEREGWLD
jgi:DNA-binding NarL/FixJ family response regulator